MSEAKKGAAMKAKIGDKVIVIGRPYGDCPEQGFRLEGCLPVGAESTIESEFGDEGDYLLSDGYFYPSVSLEIKP